MTAELDKLRTLAEKRQQVRFWTLTTIADARAARCTWKQIAEALGLNSPQAAQSRYERLIWANIGTHVPVEPVPSGAIECSVHGISVGGCRSCDMARALLIGETP